MPLSENPDVFLRDFGVPCVANAQSFTGILDTPDETMNMGGVNVLSTMYTLRCKSASVTAAGIASGTAVTVNGVAFVVRDVILEDDGVFSHLSMSK